MLTKRRTAKEFLQEWQDQVLHEIAVQREFERLMEEHFKKTGHYHMLGIKMFMPGFDIRKVYEECERRQPLHFPV